MDIFIEICIDYHKVQFIGLHSNRCDYEKVISKQAPVVKCFTEEAKIQKKKNSKYFRNSLARLALFTESSRIALLLNTNSLDSIILTIILTQTKSARVIISVNTMKKTTFSSVKAAVARRFFLLCIQFVGIYVLIINSVCVKYSQYTQTQINKPEKKREFHKYTVNTT